ncbi:MAG: hypothetical protein V3T31_09385 [candidate division Zixibacteria bacterium]
MIFIAIAVEFGQTAGLILHCLLAGAVFFAMAGLRELNSRDLQGMIYLAMAAFFGIFHLIYLNSLSGATLSFFGLTTPTVWSWINSFLAPVLIVLFLTTGLIHLAVSSRAGLFKLFFGMTLFCYLYMIGPNWPIDVRGMFALVYSGIFFDLSMKSAV